MKPFLRYVGGKSWLAPRIVPEIIAGNPKLYVEPFLGGGAIALALPPTMPKLLNDTNAALMDAWRCLQRVPAALHDELEWLCTREAESFWNMRSSVLYKTIVAEFNEMINVPRALWANRAARFLYLNARCFNGLWRVNKGKGHFNVPFAKLDKPRKYTLEEMKGYCTALRGATLETGTWQDVLSRLFMRRNPPGRPANMVGITMFVDPPYDGTFADYAAAGFDAEDQTRLAGALAGWSASGARVIATNADTPLIRDLYEPWARVEAISEQHSVGAKGESRLKKPCLLIRGGPA